MKVKKECIYCKSTNLEYSGTVIQENEPKEFYCKDCHRYQLHEEDKLPSVWK